MRRCLLIVACALLLVGCSAPAPNKAAPAKTLAPVTVTAPAPPPPAPVVSNELIEALKRLAAAEAKITMLESAAKNAPVPPNVVTALKGQQTQIDTLGGLKYDIETIKTDITAIKNRLVVIEAKLGIVP